MRRSYYSAVLLIMIIMLSFAALVSCGKKQEIAPPESSSVTEESSTVSEPVSSEEPESSAEPEEIPSEYTSLTTGITYDTVQNFYPVQVMIENTKEARPQTGLNEADIIYEAPVEYTITRFTCIFNDHHPVVAGPVRSLRMNFLGIQTEWDSILVHYGGPENKGEEWSIYGPTYDNIQITMNGVWGKHEKYFWRSSDRKAPHNAYTDVKFIADSFPDFRSTKEEFWKHSTHPSTSEKTATSIKIPFVRTNPTIEFRYDQETGMYDRYEDGERFKTYRNTDKDTRTTEEVSVNNLIVQYVPMKTAPDGHRVIYMTGSGKCEAFIGGKQITGTWERTSDTSLTHFYDENGNDIVLAVGTTWICVQPDSGSITVE